MSDTAKHAYLIMAHHQFDLLKMLCSLLDYPNHDLYIHIDSKTACCPFDDIKQSVKFSKIYFTDRTSVNWGGYSQINCELTLLDAAVNSGEKYSYYHLISGVDLPLKTAEEIYRFFEANSGKEFIQCDLGSPQWQESIKKRVNHYCIFQEKAGRSNKLWQKRQDKLRRWQYRLEIDRTKNIGKTLYNGANWFSITDKLARFILQNKNWIKKHFNHTICADEVFLQALIGGTEFENALYEPFPQTGGAKACMRYIDWKRGEPYTFTEADFDELINCECLFARKFDISTHPEICRKLYEHLKKTSE